jgi:hypothetical protein
MSRIALQRMRTPAPAEFGALTNGIANVMKACAVRRVRPTSVKVLGWVVCVAALCAGAAFAANPGGKGLGVFPPAPLVPAAPVPPQFDITGFIQEATLDSAGTICHASDPRLAGGTLRVNDILVIVPCNTVLQMPAATLTWQELFSLAPRDIGLPLGANGIPTQTGLALKDSVTLPLATAYSNGRLPSYEVHVQGNVVGGSYIAGLIFISQQNLNFGQGTITAIDYNNGELQIASAGPTMTVARVKINDPLGRFGLAHGGPGSGAALIEPSYDQRFSIDEESPTIHALTGFPMCIPRSNPATDADDPLCPQANRPRSPDCASLTIPFPPFAMPPAGQFCTSYMMPAPPSNSCTPGLGVTCPPDPTQQAPFEVGDFIDFQGTIKFDSKGPYISAHTIVDHVGIFTYPGIMPAYASIEMELQGTAALPIANLPQEVTSKVKVEGFTTDPSNLIDIYAVDVDPITGATSERLLGIASPSGPPVVGRFRFRPNGGAFLPPVREFRVVSRTMCTDPSLPCRIPTSPQTYANGLIAGQYHAPNFEFIFPENLNLGDAMVSANFQDFVFLYCGSGPLTTPSAGTTPPLVGQLDPGPWAAPMPDPMFALTLCPTAKRVDGTAGNSVPPTPTVAADTVAITTATWDNRQSKGKLNIVASSSAITGPTAPVGMSMSATFWNSTLATGLPGSTSNPITAPLSLVQDLPGQPPVCGSSLPCFSAALVGLIVNPGTSSTVSVFVPPTSIVVKSSLGGSATATGAAILVR